MYTPPSEWTPGRRALPPWPTTTSSSRGPKGSSATVYPTLAAVHVYSSSYCLYYTTHYWNISDYRCISLRPHTYVLWCQCQVKFRLGVTAFNNAGPNPLSYYSEEIKATMSSQSSYSSVQNRNVEKKPNQSCQSVIPFVMGDVSREDSTSLW